MLNTFSMLIDEEMNLPPIILSFWFIKKISNNKGKNRIV